MNQEELERLIEINPSIMMGKPVIKGTRITVELILERFAAGETYDDLQVSFPNLTRRQIQAAFLFATLTLKGDSVYPIAI